MGARKQRYFRCVRTLNERKQNEEWEKYGLVRRCRCGRNLPSNWDDIYRASARDKSWKNRFRKRKQWMKKTKTRDGWAFRYGDYEPEIQSYD